MIDFKRLSEIFGIDIASIKAIDFVESSGNGFERGKIKIQFEPSWFKRLANIIISNGVENQDKEWIAFNLAFNKDQNKAMESTSWGRMQVMGFHWRRLGFTSVGEMVDFAKASETNQLFLGLKFIQTDKKLFEALKNKDWKTVAYRYNGANYLINKYNTKLKQAYEKFI